MTPCPVIRKIVAYILHQDRDRVLVFEHIHHPEAGLQVPAGTLRDGEEPEIGVLREAHEETGLSGLTIIASLGERVFDARLVRQELHHRFFFQLACSGGAPETWIHNELHDGLAPPTAFRFFWMSVTDAHSKLAAGQGEMLDRLHTE